MEVNNTLEELHRRVEELETLKAQQMNRHLWARETGIRRMQSIIVFSESHPLRFILGITELISAIKGLMGASAPMILDLVGPQEWATGLWSSIMLVTAVLQFHFLIRGQYNRKDTLVFAAWDSTWWVFIASLMLEKHMPIHASQFGITLAAAWVFVSSGVKAYGRRGTDYAD